MFGVLTLSWRMLALFSLMAPFLLPFALLQSQRLVQPAKVVVFDSVETAKAVLSKFNPRRMTPGIETKVSVGSSELSSAVNVALSRVFPNASALISGQTDGVHVAGTIEVPKSFHFFGKYLNVSVVIAQSDEGLEFAEVDVGSIALPASLVRPVTDFVIDQIVGDGNGQLALNSVRSVQVDGSQINVAFKIPDGLFDDFKAAAGNLVHGGNVQAIRAYYVVITEISRAQSGKKQISFAKYMSACVELASQRSATHDASEENRAMILALAVFFGDSRFSMLLGQVTTGIDPNPSFNRGEVKLSGRHDWVQHFVTSAALEVAAGSDIANLIGESKEILDAEGPSGFSFTDIAADRAGVMFAVKATQSNFSARRLHEVVMKNASESAFFPDIVDLPEGLTETQFKALYIDVGAPEYGSVVRIIDRRIRAADLHID